MSYQCMRMHGLSNAREGVSNDAENPPAPFVVEAGSALAYEDTTALQSLHQGNGDEEGCTNGFVQSNPLVFRAVRIIIA